MCSKCMIVGGHPLLHAESDRAEQSELRMRSERGVFSHVLRTSGDSTAEDEGYIANKGLCARRK